MGTRRFELTVVTGLYSGSFVLPVDYDASGSLTVLCIGGGGGGAKRANSSGGGGGGGGGAVAQGSFSGLQPGRTIYYSVGVAGSGGQTAGGQNGGAGTDSWVNINSNAAPTTTGDGVLAKGGSGGSSSSGGAGGAAGSSLGSLGTASGGTGGSGGTSNGSGGGGGAAAGRYTYADNTYGTGGNGGNGFNTAGDGGGGGGGGVLGAGSSSFSINGANGGIGYGSAAGGAGSVPGTQGFNSTNPGAGGGGGGGVNSNGAIGMFGGLTAPNLVELSGELASNYGYSGGGGGGGGGSNNSSTTGGGGGQGFGTDTSGNNGTPGLGAPRSYGGGGGGGGSGTTNSGTGGGGGPGVIIITYTSKETMLPTTNLSFTNIQSYFGGSNPVALTEYYRNTGVVSQYAKNNSNTLIPTSGAISANNFRGAPYKLYRQVDAGASITPSKFFTSVTAGYSSAISVGAINSTAFTLSGGTSVAITDITKANLGPFIFRVSSASAVSNSGWDYLIIDETSSATNVYSRTDATFESGTTISTWTWTATTLISNFDLGSDFVIKFV
jgi:hypothetical protein